MTTSIKAALCAISIVSTLMTASAAAQALPICPTNGKSEAVRLSAENKSHLASGALSYFLTEPTTNGAEVRIVLNPDTSDETTDRIKIADPDGVKGKIGSEKGLDLTMDKPTNDSGARATVCLQLKS